LQVPLSGAYCVVEAPSRVGGEFWPSLEVDATLGAGVGAVSAGTGEAGVEGVVIAGVGVGAAAIGAGVGSIGAGTATAGAGVGAGAGAGLAAGADAIFGGALGADFFGGTLSFAGSGGADATDGLGIGCSLPASEAVVLASATISGLAGMGLAAA